MRAEKRLALAALGALAIAGGAFDPAPARAQAVARSVAPDSEYHDLIGRALQEFNLGHWTEAKVYFSKAHALQPSARTLRGLGLAAYESRNYVEAIAYLEQALVHAVQPLTPPMREAAARLLEEARQFVIRARVRLEPAGAELRVDDKPVQLAADGGMLLDPGEHELSAQAPGYRPLRRRVEAEGGRELAISLRLEREAPAAVPAAPAPAPVRQPLAASEPAQPRGEAPGRSSGSVAPWIVVGGSAAVAVAGGVVLALGLSAKASVEGAGDDTEWSAQRDNYDRAVPLQIAGGTMLGAGLAGAIAGLVWKYGFESDGREAESVALDPGGVTLRARW